MLRACWLLVLLVVPALVASATYKAEGVPWPKVPHHKRVPLLYRHANLPQPDEQRQGRIVGGIVATRGQFKYQVALMIDGSVLCGGALVSDRVVLTAAQCAVGHTSFQAHLGAQQFYNNNEAGRQIITSVDVRVHEQYNSVNFNNDLALIRLPTPAVTSQYVEAVEMASALGGDFAGQSATISGWGTLVDGSYTISNELRYNTVNIISNADCSNAYGPEVITSGVICQNGADVGSPCLGDSGTGMTVTGSNGRPTLVGISSFVSKTEGCQGSHPAGYIRISAYRDWIAANSP